MDSKKFGLFQITMKTKINQRKTKQKNRIHFRLNIRLKIDSKIFNLKQKKSEINIFKRINQLKLYTINITKIILKQKKKNTKQVCL